MATVAAEGHDGWQARLQLRYRHHPLRTVLAQRERCGPLSVQRSLYPEGPVCHTLLLHPPGGVVGGDRLGIGVEVGPGAEVLITTPGATKFYRSAGRRAIQNQTIEVDGGVLEWFPQENILFPGADCLIGSVIELRGAARLIGWEIHQLGRPVIGERFDRGRAEWRLRIDRDQQPLLHERLLIATTDDIDRPAGLRGWPVVATLFATLPAEVSLEPLRDSLSTTAARHRVALTRVDGLLLARYLGDSASEARHQFIQLWQQLRPLICGRPAIEPRIWST